MNEPMASAYAWSAQGGVGTGVSGANEHGGASDPQQTMPEPEGQSGAGSPVVDEQTAASQATERTNNDTETAISQSAQ